MWKDIPGWEGAYQVSRTGLVRSVDRTIRVKDPFGVMAPRTFTGRVLRPYTLKNGYSMVSLTGPGRKRYYGYVHDLVLRAWRGPKPPRREVCHRDGTKDNNSLSNLRYGTRQSNIADRKRNGKPWVRGERISASKLKAIDVLNIRALAGTMSQRKIAAVFGVSHSTVGLVLRKEGWAHVNG